jgi:ribosomal protein S18 acetylase RimI-like enzyme
MNNELLFLNENNHELFYKIFSSANAHEFLNYSIDLTTFEKFLTLLNINKKYSFVLIEDNMPAGLFLSSTKNKKGYIPAIAVVKNMRRRGLGRIILEKGISLLAAGEIANVSLEVEKENIPAVNLYKNSGFKIGNEILSFRNEKNTFYNKSLTSWNDFKIEKTDSFTFQLIFKNLHLRDKIPFQRNLHYILSKLDVGGSELYLVKKIDDTYGYFVVSRKVNTLQIEDMAFVEYDKKIFAVLLTLLITNEKIVQANGFYPDDPAVELFLKNDFYLDMTQLEMKKDLRDEKV